MSAISTHACFEWRVLQRSVKQIRQSNYENTFSAKLHYTDTGYGPLYMYNTIQRTSSQQLYNLLCNKFATSQCHSPTYRHVKMLGCGKFLSVGSEFVVPVQQVVELLWTCPLVVLYNMTVAGVRVVEFGTNIAPCVASKSDAISRRCHKISYSHQTTLAALRETNKLKINTLTVTGAANEVYIQKTRRNFWRQSTCRVWRAWRRLTRTTNRTHAQLMRLTNRRKHNLDVYTAGGLL